MEDVDHAAGAVDLDQVALADHPGGTGRTSDGGQTVLAGDTRSMAGDAANLGHEARDHRKTAASS